MTTCALYTTMLADAQTALHKLSIGGKVESIRAGEKQLTYSRANIADLRSYVSMLQGKVDACNGVRCRGRAVLFTPSDC